MIKVGIVGMGVIGTHIAKAIANGIHGITLSGVTVRKPTTAGGFSALSMEELIQRSGAESNEDDAAPPEEAEQLHEPEAPQAAAKTGEAVEDEEEEPTPEQAQAARDLRKTIERRNAEQRVGDGLDVEAARLAFRDRGSDRIEIAGVRKTDLDAQRLQHFERARVHDGGARRVQAFGEAVDDDVRNAARGQCRRGAAFCMC